MFGLLKLTCARCQIINFESHQNLAKKCAMCLVGHNDFLLDYQDHLCPLFFYCLHLDSTFSNATIFFWDTDRGRGATT